MFGYVAATLLFTSCLGQVPHKPVDRGHGTVFSFNDYENFGNEALRGGIGGGIGQPASFGRPKVFGGAPFEGPKNVQGFRDFRNGNSHGGLPDIDTKGTSVHGFASVARPKSIADGKFNSPNTEIGQAFAHVSQTFGSPSDFKEISVHEKDLGNGVPQDKSKVFAPVFGHNGLSPSGAEFGTGAVHDAFNSRGVSYNGLSPSEGIKSFGNEGITPLGEYNNLQAALNVENRFENRPSEKLGFISVTGNTGRRGFNGGPIPDFQQFEGVSAHRQFSSPEKFEGFHEGAEKSPHVGNFGSDIPNGGQRRFESAFNHGGFPFNDHRFGKAPIHGGSSFAAPTRFEGAQGQDNIVFPDHRHLGGQPLHSESAFNKNIGFGGGPTHGGHNGFDVHVGNRKNEIHGGSAFGDNIRFKESSSHGVHSFGEHEGLSRRPLIDVPPLDDSSVYKFGVNGIHENKFGSATSQLDKHPNLNEAHINKGLVGHHGPLPNNVASSFIGGKHVPEKLSEERPHFGSIGFNDNGFRGNNIENNGFDVNRFTGNGLRVNEFNRNRFDGHGFGTHGFGGSALGGNDFDGNRFGGGRFQSNEFIGNFVRGSPVNFENAKQNNLRVGSTKDGSLLDGSKEFVGKPTHGQNPFSNPFGSSLRQLSPLSNVNKEHDRINGFGLGFVHGSSSLNGPNNFQEGLVGIGSLHRQESVHSVSPFNQAKEPEFGSFQRGPFFEGSSQFSSNEANKDINGPSKHGHLQNQKFSDTKLKGLGTEIIHIGSFDSVGLGKRSQIGLEGNLNSHGPSPLEIKEKQLANVAPNFGTQKRFQSEATNIVGPKNINRGVTHKRSHGLGHSPNRRTPFEQTNTFTQLLTNRGPETFNNGPINTKSLLGEPKTFGGNKAFRESLPKGEITGGSKRIKQAIGNEGKPVLKKGPDVEATNFQHKEPVKSGPLYISHREYANEGPKEIVREKVNIPTKPQNDVSPPGKLIIRNSKESSRGRLANSG